MNYRRGTPGDLSLEVIQAIKTLRRRNRMSYGAISRKLNVPRSTVRYHAQHDEVREERNHNYARTHKRVREQHCTICLGNGHNAATCDKAKRVA